MVKFQNLSVLLFFVPQLKIITETCPYVPESKSRVRDDPSYRMEEARRVGCFGRFRTFYKCHGQKRLNHWVHWSFERESRDTNADLKKNCIDNF